MNENNTKKKNKQDYIINNVSKLSIMERREVAKKIWDYNIENRKYMEEKGDGILVKIKFLNDNLLNNIYSYIYSILEENNEF